MKHKKIVQLGEKVDGKIRKMEQYTIPQIIRKLFNCIPEIVTENDLSFFRRLKKSNMQTELSLAFEKGRVHQLKMSKKWSENTLNAMIDQDKSGKKEKSLKQQQKENERNKQNYS